jgi:hypothetical protein
MPNSCCFISLSVGLQHVLYLCYATRLISYCLPLVFAYHGLDPIAPSTTMGYRESGIPCSWPHYKPDLCGQQVYLGGPSQPSLQEIMPTLTLLSGISEICVFT